ncbi:MAG: hypothetical protein WCS27_18780 [Victivallaceae bacterium]
MFSKTRKIIAEKQPRISEWGILGFWVPFFLFFVWFGKGFFFRPFLFIFSGNFFREIFSGHYSRPFNIIHAGSAMDQPTIGKFLIWFIFFSAISIIYSIVIRLCCDVKKKKKYIAFSIPFIFVVVLVLSFLMAPASLLFHYILSMGITIKRLFGVAFICVSALIWFVFAIFLLRRNLSLKKSDFPSNRS